MLKIFQKIFKKNNLQKNKELEKEGNSIQKEGNSIQNEGNSIQKDGNSIQNEGNSIQNEGNSIQNDKKSFLKQKYASAWNWVKSIVFESEKGPRRFDLPVRTLLTLFLYFDLSSLRHMSLRRYFFLRFLPRLIDLVKVGLLALVLCAVYVLWYVFLYDDEDEAESSDIEPVESDNQKYNPIPRGGEDRNRKNPNTPRERFEYLREVFNKIISRRQDQGSPVAVLSLILIILSIDINNRSDQYAEISTNQLVKDYQNWDSKPFFYFFTQGCQTPLEVKENKTGDGERPLENWMGIMLEGIVSREATPNEIRHGRLLYIEAFKDKYKYLLFGFFGFTFGYIKYVGMISSGVQIFLAFLTDHNLPIPIFKMTKRFHQWLKKTPIGKIPGVNFLINLLFKKIFFWTVNVLMIFILASIRLIIENDREFFRNAIDQIIFKNAVCRGPSIQELNSKFQIIVHRRGGRLFIYSAGDHDEVLSIKKNPMSSLTSDGIYYLKNEGSFKNLFRGGATTQVEVADIPKRTLRFPGFQAMERFSSQDSSAAEDLLDQPRVFNRDGFRFFWESNDNPTNDILKETHKDLKERQVFSAQPKDSFLYPEISGEKPEIVSEERRMGKPKRTRSSKVQNRKFPDKTSADLLQENSNYDYEPDEYGTGQPEQVNMERIRSSMQLELINRLAISLSQIPGLGSPIIMVIIRVIHSVNYLNRNRKYLTFPVSIITSILTASTDLQSEEFEGILTGFPSSLELISDSNNQDLNNLDSNRKQK